MGSRKTPGSKDLSPFTHTSPGEPAVPHVITADNSVRGGGGDPVCLCCRENLLFPHPWRMTGPYCFHSFTPPLPWLLSVLAWDRIWWIPFFFFFCLVNSAFTPHMVYIVHLPPGELCDNLQWLYLNVALMGDLSWFLLYHMQTMVENN